MAGPEQQAANQLQVKRSAESEAQPAPVAKKPVTQEFEEKKDVQDGATVEPSPETNHVDKQAVTNQNDAQPTGDVSVGNEQEDGVHESAEQLPTEAAKAQENFEQDTDEATAKQREIVEAAEEAVKEAVAATVPAKETTHDDQVKVPQESMQNGATHTTVTKSSDEDANGTGKAPVVPETATPPTHLPNSGEDKVTAPVQD
ncbi:unnamed protein product [Sphagnum troendelagicum]|uniref:Uncharacterized protein n=1 Tax=Sphagnum troendelagicum TaxID=128251 RepID=A0ABP0U8B4_9BRYO